MVEESVLSVDGTSELLSTISVSELSVFSDSSTVIFSGSNNIVPGVPNAALTLTFPSNINCCFPDTSTNPPSPEKFPPLALIFPAKLVIPSDQIMT